VTYEILENTEDFVTFTFENYLCLLYKTRVTAEAIHSSYRGFKKLREKYDKIFFIGVTPANLEAPTVDTSAVIRRWLHDVEGGITASMIIHQDVGWRLPIVRGITASIAWLAKIPFPHKAFATVSEAAFWLHQHYQVDGVLVKDTLLKAIEDLQGKPLPAHSAKQTELR